MKTGLIARWIFSRRRNLHKKKKIFYWKTLIHSGTIAGGSPKFYLYFLNHNGYRHKVNAISQATGHNLATNKKKELTING